MGKRKIAAILSAISLLGHGVTASAADSVTMSLDKAIDLALTNNQAVVQSQEDRESARWNLSATRRQTGLRLNWSAQANYIGGKYYRPNQDNYAVLHTHYGDEEFERAIGREVPYYPPYHTETSHTFQLTMPLYTGGRYENQIERAGYALNYADMSLEYTKQNTRYQAAEAYFRVLEYNENIKVQQEAVSVLQRHLDTLQIQYEVGTIARGDMLQTSVQLANYKQQLNSAWGNYESAVATLNNVIGLPVDTVLVTNETLDNTPYSLNENECLEYALAHRPEGIAADYRIKQAEARIGETKSGYRPTINAHATARTAGEKWFKSDHTAEYWQIGLEMNWDIFDNGVTSAQVNEAKAEKRKAESQKVQQMDTIRLDVHNAYIELMTAEKNIAVATNTLKDAETFYAIAQVRYSEGVDTNLNVMEAQRRLTEARSNYNNALYNYNVSKAKMEKAIGVPVTIETTRYVVAVEEGKSSPKALRESDISLVYADGEKFESSLEQTNSGKPDNVMESKAESSKDTLSEPFDETAESK